MLALLIGGGACSKAPLARPAAPAPAAPRAAARASSLSACCAQCLEASSRDPAGMDLSIVGCDRYRGSFGGGAGVDAACAALLERAHATVGSCQAAR